MANTQRAIEDAQAALDGPMTELPRQFLPAMERRIAAVLRAVAELQAEFSEFRTKTIAEIDELRDQLADARTTD